MKHEIIDRFRGCLYGQAIGDALGLGTECMTDEDISWKYPNGLQHYNQIYQDRHRKRWKIGDWTDDTDMMLCIADAVNEDKGVKFGSSDKVRGIPTQISTIHDRKRTVCP